jgi:competence protein ComEC
MPPVVSFTLAYVAGLLSGSVAAVPTPVAAVVAVAAGAAVAAAHGWRRSAAAAAPAARWWGVLLTAVLAGVVVGAGNVWIRGTDCVAVWPSGRVAAVVDWHDAPSARETATATVRHSAAVCGGLVRLRVTNALVPDRLAGARVIVVGLHRGWGVVRVERLRVLGSRRDARYAMRDRVAQRIGRLYGPRAPLVEALVLGRKDGIAPDLRASFVEAGLAHLLAISGLHVGIVAGWLFLVLRALGVGRWTPATAAVVVWAYVALLGFPAPATRAAAFVTLYAVARWRQRHPPLVAVLAVAGLVVVSVEPRAVTAIGAWLSAAAVWGVSRGARLVPRRLARAPLVGLATVSVGATVATAPFTAAVFGQVAPVGLLANLVAVPLAGLAVPGVFASLVGGDLFAGGAGLALAGIEATAGLAAAMPGGQIVGEPGPAFAWPFVLVLVGFASLTADRRRVPGRPMVVGVRVLAAAGVMVWIGAIARDVTRRPSGLFEMHILDVGQGDAIALRTPAGRWVLVDGGPPRQSPVPALRRRGVRRLSAVVVSHGDADHLGGVLPAVHAFAPELVLEPGQPLTSALYQEFLRAVDVGGVRWQPARAGDTLVVDEVTLAVLHPTESWITSQFVANENSVVLHLRYRCFDALLTGDIGAAVERRLIGTLGPMDVLKVGHHGSAGSTTPALLAATRAPIAIISVGRGNRYGHPDPQVLRRLGAQGARVYRTDRGGPVTLRTDGRYLEVEQGGVMTLAETILCWIRRWLPSSGSSSSRSACIRVPRVSSPICSTT